MNNKIKYSYIFFTIIIAFSITSCFFSLETEKTVLKQKITVQANDQEKTVINGKTLTSAALSGVTGQKLNASNTQHIFTLHKLPVLTKKSSVKYSQVHLELDGYTYTDLDNKDFFLIISNASSSTDTDIQISDSLRTIVIPDDSFDSIVQEQELLSQSSVASLTDDYMDFNSSTVGKTQRSMMFLQAAEKDKNKKSQTTLFKKIETTIQGKTIRILIWIDNTADKSRADRILTLFEQDFFTDKNGTSLYKMLYTLNGNSHFWGAHQANNVAAPESALHIGFGTLNNNQNENTLGFISPHQFFTTKISKNAEKESVIEPTIYLHSDFLKNESTLSLYRFYSTFLHELQHINHLYNRNISKYPGNNISTQTYMGDSWFNEFIAIMTEHVFLYTILEKLDKADALENTLDYAVLDGIRKGYYQFNFNLFKYQLLQKEKLVTKVYDLHQIFSSYILANYGADIISNLMHNNSTRDFKVNEEAIFDAISNAAFSETFYKNYQSHHQPQSFDEVINDFYVSNLLSEVPVPFTTNQNDAWISAGPTKMYVYSDNNLSKAEIRNGNESVAIISELPVNNSNIKSIFNNNRKFVTYNTVFSPYQPQQRDSTYTSIAQNDAEINFPQFWLKGGGAILSSKSTMNQQRSDNISGTLQQGLGVFLYLGGKSAKNKNASSISFPKLLSTDKDVNLSLDIQIPTGSAATLVILE